MGKGSHPPCSMEVCNGMREFGKGKDELERPVKSGTTGDRGCGSPPSQLGNLSETRRQYFVGRIATREFLSTGSERVGREAGCVIGFNDSSRGLSVGPANSARRHATCRH